MSAMMWFLATLERPEKMQRLIDSMSEADKAQPFCVIYWEGDRRLRHYADVSFPAHWEHHITPHNCVRDKSNWFYSRYPNLDVYAGVSDDLIIDTPDMLTQWRAATDPWSLTWCEDGWCGRTMAAHWAMGGEFARSYARALGGHLAHPDFAHYGLEAFAFRVAVQLDLAKFLPHLKYTVLHPKRMMPEEDDETHRRNRRLYDQGEAILEQVYYRDHQKVLSTILADYEAAHPDEHPRLRQARRERAHIAPLYPLYGEPVAA